LAEADGGVVGGDLVVGEGAGRQAVGQGRQEEGVLEDAAGVRDTEAVARVGGPGLVDAWPEDFGGFTGVMRVGA
jgi:hypothetical protein